MKKVVFAAIAVLGFTFAQAQSNQKGTIHINVMGGLFTGSSTQEYDGEEGKDKYTVTGSAFGANFQYGIAESFSIGIGLEGGTITLSPKDYDPNNPGDYNYEPALTTFKVNFSGRYYFVNAEKFNVYAGPSIGFTTAKNDEVITGGFGVGASQETKYSGLNYGVNVGGNYFFTDIVGVIVNVGYEGNSLKSTTSQEGINDFDGTATLGGLKVMAGLALKF